ncbi:hypothetical protein L484_019299 [Morus notabilis]|uniref:Uncharacterized protein n=1 Tax=Morus notabilis TaxID=981085 RepID=W9RRJ7_9ROSA|nr:hypothetical protein L484_019299 [Morus notabilis]
MALDSSILNPPKFANGSKSLSFLHYNTRIRVPTRIFSKNNWYPFCVSYNSSKFRNFLSKRNDFYFAKERLRPMGKNDEAVSGENESLDLTFKFLRRILKCGIVSVAVVCKVLIYGYKRAFAIEGVVNAGCGVIG